MRTKPVGTGPFKFVEFKANESIKLVRNPDYWKKGLPHLDGIEFTIIPNRSTAILGFIAGKFDMTFPTEVSIPLLRDVKAQAPNAVCVVEPVNVSTNIIVNSSAPPFDNLDIRRAMALDSGSARYLETPNQRSSKWSSVATHSRPLPLPASRTFRWAFACRVAWTPPCCSGW
jgi:ABC-type oligopeptide transport system substrate-binding subunit